MKYLFLAAAFFITSFAFGQTKTEWKEKDDFHTVMSQTFHPSEEGKLEPIKTRIGEMVDKAVAWQESKVPEGLDAKSIKKNLKKLVSGSKSLQKKINAGASDEYITKKLSDLHDIFHKIVGMCSTKDHDHKKEDSK
ncbi:MAG: hypothetical protein JSS63_02280 [Bacteroidetes bacterium]|nr:hypothetical protein [Bacteroidota bacterium]